MTFIDVFIRELSDGPDPHESDRGPAPIQIFSTGSRQGVRARYQHGRS
jgi:hypothetical protein